MEQESDASIAEKVMCCDNKSRSGTRGGEKRKSLAYLGSGTKTGCVASVKLPRYNLLFVAWLRIALGARVRSEEDLLC